MDESTPGKSSRHAIRPWLRGIRSSTLHLLIAQARTRLGEAVPAEARVHLIPGNARPVLKRLRGTVQPSCPGPVACIAGQARQAKAVTGHAFAVPVLAVDPQAALNADRTPSRSPSARSTRPPAAARQSPHRSRSPVNRPR